MHPNTRYWILCEPLITKREVIVNLINGRKILAVSMQSKQLQEESLKKFFQASFLQLLKLHTNYEDLSST